MVSGPHYCYIIYNDKNRIYIGYTNNPIKRLRQHNGEISGGARATHNRGEWHYLMIIELFESKHNVGLQCEYALKHPTNQRKRPKFYNGKEGSINSIPLVMNNPKFSEISFQIRVIPDFYQKLFKLCSEYKNVEIVELL